MSNEAILRAMVSMARADSQFGDAERANICEIYEAATGEPTSVSEIERVVAEREAGGATTNQWLAEHATGLSKTDQERLITAAYKVLLFDGVVAAEERKRLKQIARAIGMEEIHYKMVLEDVSG